MTGEQKRDWEQQVDGFFTICEKIMLRVLLFGCFTWELSKFAWWLLIGGH